MLFDRNLFHSILSAGKELLGVECFKAYHFRRLAKTGMISWTKTIQRLIRNLETSNVIFIHDYIYFVKFIHMYVGLYLVRLETKRSSFLNLYRNWDDWQEEAIPIHCLFCKVSSPTTQEILNHMKV